MHMNGTHESPTICGTEQADPDESLNHELEFLWQDRGQSGKAYDIYLGRISRNPVVRSRATGEYFMLPWSQIIELAVQKGIDVKPNGSPCWGWGINE